MKEWIDFFYYVFLKRVYKLNPEADIQNVRNSATHHITWLQAFLFFPIMILVNEKLFNGGELGFLVLAIFIMVSFGGWNIYLLQHTDYYKRLFETYDKIDPSVIVKRRMKVYLFNWSMYVLSYSSLFYL
jgi:hypothetical protein